MGGVAVDALVDTGAQVTLLAKSIYDSMTPKPLLRNTGITVNGPCAGARIKVVGISDCQLVIGGLLTVWPMYICENITTSMLLGEDFLRHQGVVIDFTTDKMIFHGQQIRLNHKSSFEVCRVTFKESVLISSNSVMNISCKVYGGPSKEGTHGVVEPLQQFEEKYNLGVMRVAAKVKNGEVPIRIINHSNDNVYIWKGSSVGQLFPLVDNELLEESKIPTHCYFVQTSCPIRRDINIVQIKAPDLSDIKNKIKIFIL